MVDIKIIKGSNLSSELFKEIAKIITTAFPWDEPLTKDFVKDNIFFIIYDKCKIVSVGRLKPDKIIFLKKKYNLMGVADIVSAEKGKGYGKTLMKSITEYLKEKNILGLGLCARKNSEFYEKCGFTIAKDLAKRFYFNGPQSNDDDVLYYNDIKCLINQILANPDENVNSKCKSW
ncbi:MAG: GNAT family N-acetyltransferase [Candidatus Nanoarchaeia archaeon]|nr:GNAT family N-acetyltransferase [Candidatus Nanoarchaeia archaeon]